jgi:hypothetical protein
MRGKKGFALYPALIFRTGCEKKLPPYQSGSDTDY